MSESKPLTTAFEVPPKFSIQGVPEAGRAPAAEAVPPAANLGPLSAFQGTFAGQGFNTIFRPDSQRTPTPMPAKKTNRIEPPNVLELNLTQETLSFSNNLGSIPNRGNQDQADLFMNGVPYVQSVSDVTTGAPVGIHFEPGIWLAVPATTSPNEPVTVARMGSIPHGVTIEAQGVALPAIAGKPEIGQAGITPFLPPPPPQPGGPPPTATAVSFPSQKVANDDTTRIPQDLTALGGKITQPMLDDPNTVLRNQIANQNITQTIEIRISTNLGNPIPNFVASESGAKFSYPPPPFEPVFGGGNANIAFLAGHANPPAGGTPGLTNANAFQMDAVFFIETVVYDVKVPPLPAGTPPIVLQPIQTNVPVVPSFVAAIPFVPGKGFAGGIVRVATTQIQYCQKVVLDFANIRWPHVSVATLVPSAPIPIPADLLPLT